MKDGLGEKDWTSHWEKFTLSLRNGGWTYVIGVGLVLGIIALQLSMIECSTNNVNDYKIQDF